MWRSSVHPRGLPGLSGEALHKVTLGNLPCDWLGSFLLEAHSLQIPFWVENPRRSYLWQLAGFKKLSSANEVGFWYLTFCAFGTPWQKRTSVLTSTGLRGHYTPCPRCSHHIQLRGYSRAHKMSWTKVAEPYLRGVACVLAMSLVASSGPRPEFRDLDVAASLPGPGKQRILGRHGLLRRSGQSAAMV